MDSTRTTIDRKPGCLGRICAETKRLLLLLVVVGLVVVAGKYYCFDRLDEEIRAHVEGQLRAHYRGLSVSVRSARRIPGRGVEIRGVRIAEAGSKAPVVAAIDEIFAECDTRLPDFLTKPPKITSIRVHRLKLRAERKPTGFWNLSHLLPLPPSPSSSPPVATITDSALEIVDPTEGPACAWMLRNIELTVQPETEKEFRSPGTLLRVRGTLAGDHLERMEIDGLLDPQSGRWDLRGAVEGLEFSPRLKAALPRELSSALTPLSSVRGRTYLGFHIERPAAEAPKPTQAKQTIDGASVQFVVHGKISEGRIDDTRLPEPLTDVEATIRCDNHGILIDNLSARCGTTQLELNAALAGYGATGPIDIELTASQLELEHLPVAALPPAVRQTWERFQPRGLADVSGSLKFDGHGWQPDLKIECRNLSLLYDRFPYRLTDGSGTILVRPDTASVKLRTIGGGQPVHCRADVRDPGPNFVGWIEVQSEGGVPIDEKLLAAMDPATARVVRSFHPRGNASFNARFHRQPGDAIVHRHVEIELQDCSVRHEQFPYPIDRVSGRLEANDEAWAFRNLTGRNDSASIAGGGSWMETDRNGRQLALKFTATDVPLADELQQALPRGTQRLWSALRPRGNIDHLVVELKHGGGSEAWSIDVKGKKLPPAGNAEGRSISLEPLWFPYRFDDLSGDFHYYDGQMQLVNLHAVHGRANIAGEGVCSVLADGACRLALTRLSADRLEADQDLIAALPASLGQALGRYSVEGPMNLLGTLQISVPPQIEASPQIDWDLSLDLENGRILTPTPLEHLFGSMRVVGRQHGQGVQTQGELKVDSAVVRGVQLTNVEGPLRIEKNQLLFGAPAERDIQGRLPRQVTAKLFEGLLSLDGGLALSADGNFQVQVTLENADLTQIVREFAPHQRGLSGKVFGLARIAGNGQGMHTWRGDGQIRLRDADIYELPVMISLLKLLSIQRPDRTAFTTSSLDFRIEGDDLAFERIDFNGDAISLKGKGRMNGQREIDLKFYPVMGREERQLAIFKPLLGQTGREIMLIEVKGTLDQPQVQRKIFPRLDVRLQQLFPELARDELEEPNVSKIPGPREALERLWLMPKR